MSPTRCWLSGALSAAVLCTLAGTAQAAGDRTPEMAAGTSSVARTAHHHESGLPLFDIRTRDGLHPRTKMVQDALQASPARIARAARLAAMRQADPLLRADDDVALGTLHFLRSTGHMLTPPAAAGPTEVVRDFIAANADLLEVSPKELDLGIKLRDYVTDGLGVTHLSWQQTVNGHDLFLSRLSANVTSRGELVNISSTMLPRPEGDFTVPAATMSELEALHAAAAHCGITITQDPKPTDRLDVDGSRFWTDAPDFRPDEPVRTKFVVFPLSRSELRPAYKVIVAEKGVGNTYDVVVDAITGELLYRDNWLWWETTQPITMRVYTSDSPAPGTPGPATPNGFQAPFVPRQLVTVTPDQMRTFSPNGWIDDNGTETVGNNVDAHADRNADNLPDTPRPNGGTQRVFDLPMATDANNVPTGEPTTYTNASVVGLFYLVNTYHDRLYSLGFTEAAGNFQLTNFSGQGLGNDQVQADGQDGSGTNNANWSSSAVDGQSGPRTQMYIFNATTPDRDGTIDADVLYHECSHGLSIRLHGPQGTLGTGAQSRGMGEGWSDFFGTCLNAEAADDFAGVYTTGGYVTQQFSSAIGNNNYYFGIRRYPYSVEFNKNPLTYNDVDPAQANNTATLAPIADNGGGAAEVHNVGEVWCNTLLECRHKIGITEGFAANQIIMQLVVDGMKLAPGSPNFVQERDAILQADQIRYGGAHIPALWTVFAEHGLGEAAASPGGASVTGVVEDFNIPFRVNFTFPDPLPSQLQPGQSVTVRVDMTPQLLTIDPASARLVYSVNGGGDNEVPLVNTSGVRYEGVIPGQDCFATVRYYVKVSTDRGQRQMPEDAPLARYSAQVFQDVTNRLTDAFETESGWTVGPNTATTGLFNRMAPQPTFNGTAAAQPGVDHTPDPGSVCWVTDGNAGASVGANDVDNGYTQITSPTLDLSGLNLGVVEYWRWFYGPAADNFTSEVSADDGATWTRLERLDASANAWSKASIPLLNVGVTPTSTMRLRFRVEDAPTGTSSIVEGAVDDLRIYGYVCQNTAACNPDLNADGNADQDDVAYLVGVVAGGPNPLGADPDFNRDGNADQDDIALLVNVVAGAPCQ